MFKVSIVQIHTISTIFPWFFGCSWFLIVEDGSLQSYRQYVQGLPLSEPPEVRFANENMQ